MRFKIVSAGNNSAVGELFFSLPVDEEVVLAEENIKTICKEKAIKLYGDNSIVKARLENEIQLMQETKTAYYFLILSEVARFSKENSSLVTIQGSLGSSIIQYFLGISDINPLEFSLGEKRSVGYDMPIEMMWGSTDKPIHPDFSISINPFIRVDIHSRLDSIFGNVRDNENLFCCITMTSSIDNAIAVSMLNELTIPNDYDETVFSSVYNHFSEDKLPQKDSVSFAELVRLKAYTHLSNTEEQNFKNLENPDFFVTRDEFFYALLNEGIPRDLSYEMVVKGIWAQKKEKYIQLLENYGVSEKLKKYFKTTTNLWSCSACISRVETMLAIKWLELNQTNNE